MESPFWVPPAPSEAPNSRILAPFTGKRRCPRGIGESDSGSQTAGIAERGEVGPGRVVVDARAATRAARVALSRPCSSLAMRSLRLSTWCAEFGGALPFAVERLLGDSLLLLPLVDEHVHAQLLARKQVQVA